MTQWQGVGVTLFLIVASAGVMLTGVNLDIELGLGKLPFPLLLALVFGGISLLLPET
ncbi:hypothetical protein HYV98_00085 [Candidatus Azambacteria bacterium]|nr:hypothetical protein [Candidatus Azambacteria bacterium]